MYAAKVKGKKLTFVVSGMLWKRSLVMMDLQTKSLWSHILGKAMAGKLKGTDLEQIPSMVTDFATFKKQHPKGTVMLLSRTARSFNRSDAKERKRFVLGFFSGKKAKAWGYDLLYARQVVNETFAKTPVVVLYHRPSDTARMFHRRVDGKSLTFQLVEKKIVDKQTGSTWEPTTGKAVAGKLKGKQLRGLSAFISYRRAWQRFYPNSQLAPKD